MKSFIKQKRYLVFFILISLIALKFFDLPINVYQIYKTNHENRLEKFYGYCYPNGYGFIKELKKKFNKLKSYIVKLVLNFFKFLLLKGNEKIITKVNSWKII